MIRCYDDIIDLPHHVSEGRPRMPIGDRAAQFSPFAALTGHEAAIKEMARLTDNRKEVDENLKAILDEKLQIIQEHLPEQPEIVITYFKPDEKKAGGLYVEITGCVKKVDSSKGRVIMQDGKEIPVEDIFEIRSLLLDVLDEF